MIPLHLIAVVSQSERGIETHTPDFSRIVNRPLKTIALVLSVIISHVQSLVGRSGRIARARKYRVISLILFGVGQDAL